MSAFDRRQAEQRQQARRHSDVVAVERTARLLRMEDPASIALWELEMERASWDRQARVEQLRLLVRGM